MTLSGTGREVMLRLERRLRMSSSTLSGEGNRFSSTWTMFSGGNAGCCRAPEGQRAAQCPQAMHSSGRWTMGTVFSVACTSTFCGHSRAQAPQRRHSSGLIRMAFMVAKLRIYYGYQPFFAEINLTLCQVVPFGIAHLLINTDRKCRFTIPVSSSVTWQARMIFGDEAFHAVAG